MDTFSAALIHCTLTIEMLIEYYYLPWQTKLKSFYMYNFFYKRKVYKHIEAENVKNSKHILSMSSAWRKF